MTRPGTNFALRDALLELLSSGRAVTTAELRTKITEADEFAETTSEAIYRHLDALARRGEIQRVRARNSDRRHVHWTRRVTAASALPTRELR